MDLRNTRDEPPISTFNGAKWQLVVANLVLAAIYFAAGRFGLSLAFHFPSASPVWPPSGIALAALVIYGFRLGPGVFVGALLVNASTVGTSLVAASCIAVGNTLEAIVGAYFISTYARGRDAFHQPREIVKAVFLAAICSTAISATIGVTSAIVFGVPDWADFWTMWLTWWLGDAVSVTVITPLLLIWYGRPLPRLATRSITEAMAGLVVLALVGQLVFHGAAPGQLRLYHFLAIPPLLWLAYRFRRRGASVAIVLLAAIAISGTVRGGGPFVLRDPNESLLLLQAFIGTVSITILVLAAVVAEQIRTEQFLRVQYGISRVLAEASSLAKAAPSILKAVCQAVGWEIGAIWRVDSTAEELRCVEVWHLPSISFPEFEKDSRTRTFKKSVGLPGRIWACGQPVWVRDVTSDKNFPRASIAQREGLHAAFGFPILLNEEVLGVIEFFSCDVREPDENFLEMIGVIGSHIGQFIERKEAESALRAAKEQLRTYADELEEHVAQRTARLNDTVESLQDFSYSVAHDLRAPLRAMGGFATILREQYASQLDPEAQEYTDRIIAAASRMDRLILDLLAYGQLAHMDLVPDVVDPNAAVSEAMEQLSAEIRATDATVRVAVLPRVKGHRTVLNQVLVNLIGNAIKFVPPGVPPRVEITATVENHTACVRVHDNGIGIAQSAQDRIFDIFERGPATSKYPGTGMGLAVVRKGIERLGGKVGVKSQPGTGSCFWFELPTA